MKNMVSALDKAAHRCYISVVMNQALLYLCLEYQDTVGVQVRVAT
jgi:hypothetical protein